MRRFFQLLLVLSGLPIACWAQDITGVWQGHFRSNSNAMRSSLFDDRYKFEVQIAQSNKGFEAVTYSYLSSIFYGKAAAAGTINAHTGKVMLQEGKLLEVRNSSGDVCIMTCFMQYSKSGDEEFMEGTYVSMNVHDSSNCGRGTVFLRKVASSDFYKEPFLVKKEKEIAEHPGSAAKAAPPVKPNTPPANKGMVKAGLPKSGATTRPAGKPTPKPGGPIAKNTPPAKPTAPPVGKTTPPASKTTPPVAKTAPPAHPPAAKPAQKPAVKPDTVKTTPPLAKVTVPSTPLERPHGDSGSMGRRFPTITPKILQTRTNQVVKTLTIHSNEVTLNIYDDGAIDHDTVSVYLDNKQVISHVMLTDRPITLTLHLDDSNDYHELVMVAENEGEIPPNTSLMIVKAGEKEYEVRITSTEQKNAVVQFKYVKP